MRKGPVIVTLRAVDIADRIQSNGVYLGVYGLAAIPN